MIMLKNTIINAYIKQTEMINTDNIVINKFFMLLPFVYSSYQIINLTIFRIYCVITKIHKTEI